MTDTRYFFPQLEIFFFQFLHKTNLTTVVRSHTSTGIEKQKKGVVPNFSTRKHRELDRKITRTFL